MAVERIEPLPAFEKAIAESAAVVEADGHRIGYIRLWTLAAPRKDDVRPLAGVLGVRYRELADGEFNHTSALVLLDAEGRVLARTEQMGSKPDPEFVVAVRRAAAAK